MSKQIEVYTPQELKDLYPDTFEKVLERWQTSQNDVFWADETIESLKAVIKASGIELKDYSIDFSNSNQSWIKLEFPHDWNCDEDDIKDLHGQRALAWLENNLFYALRIPFHKHNTRIGNRWDLSKYGTYYRAGKILPCPFTGYFADDYFMDCLVKSIKAGDTLAEAYYNLASEASKLIYEDYLQQISEEEFLNQDYLFTESGRMI